MNGLPQVTTGVVAAGVWVLLFPHAPVFPVVAAGVAGLAAAISVRWWRRARARRREPL